jgi:hypothetical protein
VLKKILRSIISLDLYLEKHVFIFLLLLLVVILRLPNFSEPYWYGDEGIYLTIGQAMNRGSLLYSEIIDHKTPLIYYLAQVSSQLNFRILLFAWMIVSTVAFYSFARVLLKNKYLSFLAGLLFVIFTSLPWLEGNIPNGELFVIGFVVVAAALISRTSYFKSALAKPQQEFGREHEVKDVKNDFVLLLLAGSLLGAGILTKVPALFDAAAFFALGYYALTNSLYFSVRALPQWAKQFWRTSLQMTILFVGVIMPIIFSIAYFIFIGSGQAYLDFGLLYNFRYAGSWGLPFSNPILVFLFTLQGKVLITLLVVGVLTFARKHLKIEFQFIATWFWLALFASLLSNRPYPHYFLQVVPPAVLLVVWLIKIKLQFLKELIVKKSLLGFKPDLLTLLSGGMLFLLLPGVLLLLNVGLYPTASYYQNWWKLRSGQLSVPEYNQKFNHLMSDNYQAAALLKESEEDRIFIWGTNPMLYALSEKSPTGRFTVSFHIKDFNAFDETIQSVYLHQPRYVVVMRNENHPFPELINYLDTYYKPVEPYKNFVIWERLKLEELNLED